MVMMMILTLITIMNNNKALSTRNYTWISSQEPLGAKTITTV